MKRRVKKVKVPKFKTKEEVIQFIKGLGLDDTPMEDVVDPEFGEVLMEPGQTKRARLKRKAKSSNEPEGLWDLEVGQFRNPKHWVDLYDNDFNDFYNIVTKSVKDVIDNPEEMENADYDIYALMPTAISRKDGKPFTSTDLYNIEQYMKFMETTTIKLWFQGKKGAKRGTFSPVFA